MTENLDNSIYYNYSNKGANYQFDLSQLTPEERHKFMKLNDRQKMKFITLKDLEEEGKMKNETQFRPAYTEEGENERENKLRTIQAKIDVVNQMEKLKDLKDQRLEGISKLKDFDDLNQGTITQTDIDKILAANPNANLSTLKKYYNALLDEIRTEGETAKIKRAIMGRQLSKNALAANPKELMALLGELKNALVFVANNSAYLNPQFKPKTAEEKATKKAVEETKENITEVMPPLLNAKEEEVKEQLKSKDSIIALILDIDNYIKAEHEDAAYTFEKLPPDVPVSHIRWLMPLKTEDKNEIIKLINEIKDSEFDNERKKKEMKKIIKAVTDRFKLDDYLFEENFVGDGKKEEFPITYERVYTNLKQLFNNPEISWKSLYKNNTYSKDEQLKSNVLTGLAETLKDLNVDSLFGEAANEYFDERIKTNGPYKSGSIKNKVYKIFHPLKETEKNISAQNDKINKLENEIEKLKKEIETMKNSKNENSSVPVNRPKIEIPDKPKLKPVSPAPKIENSDSDLESQLRKEMEKRREDIEYSDSEDEDVDWGAGLCGKINLKDFLK
jgi:hypothetical protein